MRIDRTLYNAQQAHWKACRCRTAFGPMLLSLPLIKQRAHDHRCRQAVKDYAAKLARKRAKAAKAVGA